LEFVRISFMTRMPAININLPDLGCHWAWQANGGQRNERQEQAGENEYIPLPSLTCRTWVAIGFGRGMEVKGMKGESRGKEFIPLPPLTCRIWVAIGLGRRMEVKGMKGRSKQGKMNSFPCPH
jgi:hypothetical protein